MYRGMYRQGQGIENGLWMGIPNMALRWRGETERRRIVEKKVIFIFFAYKIFLE